MNISNILRLSCKHFGLYMQEGYYQADFESVVNFANEIAEIQKEIDAQICDPLNPNQNDWTDYAKARAKCASDIRKGGIE